MQIKIKYFIHSIHSEDKLFAILKIESISSSEIGTELYCEKTFTIYACQDFADATVPADCHKPKPLIM